MSLSRNKKSFLFNFFSFYNLVLRRRTLKQVTEAMDIRREGNTNNKMEGGHTELPRLAIE